MAGYDHIVIVFGENVRTVKRINIPSPPPERLHLFKELNVLDYIGTIWETPHYKLRAEVEMAKVNA